METKLGKQGQAIFITGTDTEVGKTVISSLLLGFLLEKKIKVGYQKWVSTGGEMPEDLLFCYENNGLQINPDDLDQQVVFRFLMSASPHLAAEQEGREVDLDKIRQEFGKAVAKHDILLVEGVGGVLVPLRRDMLLADFLADLSMPTLLVARSGLGTINHTLLTIEALRQRGISLLGIVFSDEQQAIATDDQLVQDNMRTIAEISGVEVFGRLPRLDDYGQLRTAFAEIGKKILSSIQHI